MILSEKYHIWHEMDFLAFGRTLFIRFSIHCFWFGWKLSVFGNEILLPTLDYSSLLPVLSHLPRLYSTWNARFYLIWKDAPIISSTDEFLTDLIWELKMDIFSSICKRNHNLTNHWWDSPVSNFLKSRQKLHKPFSILQTIIGHVLGF